MDSFSKRCRVDFFVAEFVFGHAQSELLPIVDGFCDLGKILEKDAEGVLAPVKGKQVVEDIAVHDEVSVALDLHQPVNFEFFGDVGVLLCGRL